MKIHGAEFVEKYKRPCFAVCKNCGTHGVIIYTDGSFSEEIQSLTEGEELLKELTDQNVVGQADAKRISDQLACSELPLYEPDFDIKEAITAGFVAASVIARIGSPIKPKKSNGNNDSDSDTQSFAC